MSVTQQLPLNIYLADEAIFDNFFVGEASSNTLMLAAIKDLSGKRGVETFIYLWGGSGSGLSHLLQAACRDALAQGYRSQYLPLADVAGFAPAELLEGFEHLDLLCLDDLQQVLGRPEWDEALFHLYNRIQLQGSRLLVSATCPPREIKTSLADLASRLAWGTTYHLEAMKDLEKQQALQKRAAVRGMEMSDEVARFILNHGSREPRDLFACLDKLDRKSLAEKRKLSIPFVKEIL